jgi:hypothetical protein
MKNLIFIALSILVFTGCAGRTRGVSNTDELITDVGTAGPTAASVNCSIPDNALAAAEAFAPAGYCEALATYINFKDKYDAFMASNKSACPAVEELKTKIDAIDINLVLAKFVDDEAAGSYTVVPLARLEMEKKLMMAFYNALIPSAEGREVIIDIGTGGGPVTMDSTCLQFSLPGQTVTPKFICVKVLEKLYLPLYACAAEGVDDAVAKEYFAKALSKYLSLVTIPTVTAGYPAYSTHDAAVLEQKINNILDGTTADVAIHAL